MQQSLKIQKFKKIQNSKNLENFSPPEIQKILAPPENSENSKNSVPTRKLRKFKILTP